MAGRSKVDLTTIGSRIRKLRGTMLQEELASHLNVSQGHLSKIERGKIAPSLEVLISLSARFHKSVDWILQGGRDASEVAKIERITPHRRGDAAQ
jgi:transcriptional regulator with XRE-family HTH domain